MMLIKNTIVIFLLLLAIPLLSNNNHKKDSTEIASKPPKHYFRNTVYYNGYTTSTRKLKNVNLGNYKFSESSIGFITPFYTKDIYKNDSATIANFHLLLTGNLTLSTPSFSAINSTHRLSNTSVGLRLFYSNGKKNIFFFSASPFMVHDNFEKSSASLRYASIFIYNRTVNEKFSYRLGFVKTFLFGNRYTLPIIGFRAGPLDGVHFSMILPRNMSLNFPVSKHINASIFIKPYGRLFNVINNDSLYNGNDEIIQFGKYELLNGIRLDYSNRNIDIYLSAGISKRNYLAFSSTTYQKNKNGVIVPFYNEKFGSTSFINWGLNYKFGRVKKIYNNYTVYDMIDINNKTLNGDINDNAINNDIPQKGIEKNIKKMQYEDVMDLIELEDIY